MKKFLLAALSVLLAAGCGREDPATYSGVEAGTLRSGVFTSDNGVRMTVDGNEKGYDTQSERRVLISYETHPLTEGGPVVIDLRGLWDAVIPVPVPEETVPADAADDPALISEAWFQAGYLNLVVDCFGTDAARHAFSASFGAKGEGTAIRIRHAGGTDRPVTDTALRSFLSIPMADIVPNPPAGESVPVLLQWTWYAEGAGPPDGETLLYEQSGTYLPS